jgi:hypothetical protein
MKFNIKLAAVAAALALSSSAFAAINTNSNPDLLFVAYDGAGAGGKTYVRDLGSLSQIGASNITFSAPTGSIFSTALAGVADANILWGVYALYKDPAQTATVVYQTNTLATQSGWFDSDVTGVAGALTTGLGSLTQLDLAANGYAKANGEYTGSNTITDQTNGIQLINNFSFGKPLASQGVGTSQNFISVTQDADNFTGDAAQLFTNASLSSFAAGNAKGGYFTLLDNLGDVKWTGAVATTPLPAAALLFFPGLLAMFGLGRRRNNKAA